MTFACRRFPSSCHNSKGQDSIILCEIPINRRRKPCSLFRGNIADHSTTKQYSNCVSIVAVAWFAHQLHLDINFTTPATLWAEKFSKGTLVARCAANHDGIAVITYEMYIATLSRVFSDSLRGGCFFS